MANLLNSIIYYLKDALIKNSNGDVTVPHDLTVGNEGNFKHTTVQSTDNNALYTAKKGNANVSFGAWSSGSVGIYDSYKANNVIVRNTNGDTYVHGSDLHIPPSGNIITNRGLTLYSHSTGIGAALNAWNASAVSVPNETATAITSIVIPAGCWILACGARFPSNATGRRVANISTTSGNSASHVSQPAVSGAVTQMNFTFITEVASNTRFYLNVWQNSGSTLSVPASSSGEYTFIRAMRIA